MKTGAGVSIYAAGCNMAERTAVYSSDSEMLIVAQHGVMDVTTKLGNVLFRLKETLNRLRGVNYRVDLPERPIRGYILELFYDHFVLPELTPAGSNCLANPRDYQMPVPRFDEDTASLWTVINKFSGRLFAAHQEHARFDVVGWHEKSVTHLLLAGCRLLGVVILLTSVAKCELTRCSPSLFCSSHIQQYTRQRLVSVTTWS